MQTRSSRHLDEDVSTKPIASRASKNRYLYDEVDDGIGYGKIDNFSSVKMDSDTAVKTREDYQKRTSRRDNNIKLDEVDEEDKVYDINSILEKAKQNRNISDVEEEKRNLQKAEYSILADLNKKYVSKKEREDDDSEKEEIRELIDTITSKNLPKELMEYGKKENEDDGKDLMSDLMATDTINAVGNIALEEGIVKEILNENEEEDEDEIKTEEGRLVNSFYTRSMDLTEHDFDLRNEINDDNKIRHRILILVILIVIVLLAIASLYILKKIDII